MSVYAYLVRNPLVASISNHIDTYPSPINFSYLWGFGSLAGMALVIQIVSGVLLAMHYAPEVHLAFSSVEHIMRDVRGGVALRYIHANGASMFFIVVYIHMFRGLYYGSYMQPRSTLWYTGVLLFFLMMAAGFMGYVLPWGQMSFWGATVITNLFSAIPVVGNSIVQLLWGGFSVDNPTLNRFFSFHYVIPFILAAAAVLHLILLHQPGGNNPLGVTSVYDRIPFYPYYYVKDLFGFIVFILFFSFFVIYAPNYMGHPDNYIEANPMVTPPHIVPEWYFLPFYAILRTIPDKLGGVALMGLSIVILTLIPVVDTSAFRSTFFKPLNLWLFWFFFCNGLSLGWIGQEIVESPFIEMANFVTFSYFAYFLVFLPLAGFLENAVINSELRYDSQGRNKFFNNAVATRTASAFLLLPFSAEAILLPNYCFKFAQDWFGVDLETLDFGLVLSWLNIMHVLIITLALLFLAIFIPKSIEFSRFLNRLGAFYLFYSFLIVSDDIVLGLVWTEQGAFDFDSVYRHIFSFFAIFTVIFFLYGIIDRFFIGHSAEIEFIVILFLIYLSALLMMNVQSLLDFVLGLEILTLASYVYVAFERHNKFSATGGIQYLLIGSVPSAVLFLGVGLTYARLGSLNFNDLAALANGVEWGANRVIELDDWSPKFGFSIDSSVAEFVFSLPPHQRINWMGIMFITPYGCFMYYELFYVKWWHFRTETLEAAEILKMGFLRLMRGNTNFILISTFLMLFNLLFKLTAAPFNFWAPSVYGKAPIAAVTYLSIFTKLVAVAMTIKFCFAYWAVLKLYVGPFLIVCGILSILFGMVGAFVEKAIKRFYVYSSMGHVGFMLVSLGLFSMPGFVATLHYLALYILSSYIMWFVLLQMGRDSTHLTHFKNLGYYSPLLGFMFAFMVFSMSGLPPLGGFFVKLDVLYGLAKNSWLYVGMLLFVFTVASFFYYLRLIKILFFDSIGSGEVEVSEKETALSPIAKHPELSSSERLWMISVLFLILLFYMVIVQAPLLGILSEGLDMFGR